jgi:hypothetical protein
MSSAGKAAIPARRAPAPRTALQRKEKQFIRRILALFLGRLSKLDSSGDEIGELSTEIVADLRSKSFGRG